MGNDDRFDPATGLLHRQGFLQEVRDSTSSKMQGARRGCLLVLHFPAIQALIAKSQDIQAADDAMRHLLAIIETRLRTRDTLGRISQHSFCIFLKACKDSDAVVVADQFAAILNSVVIQVDLRQLSLNLRYRIIPLDSHGTRARQGVSRFVVAPTVSVHSKLAKQIDVAGNLVDLSTSKVISLNSARREQSDLAKPVSPVASQDNVHVLPVGARNAAGTWRLRPGMLIQRKPLVCCFRLQPVGVESSIEALQESDVFASMLSALSLSSVESRPIIESQLILSIKAEQIGVRFPAWIARCCQQMRVSPSDICLSLHIDRITHQLASVAPVLRSLNGQGIRLMLEGVTSSSQFRILRDIAQFDYLHVSGRALNDSASRLAARVQLDGVISDARKQECEICADGIDSPAALQHALELQVEIGFGRLCGSSIGFPAQAWKAAAEIKTS